MCPVAVGIDLGTTNSGVARVDAAGRTVMIRNRDGDVLTPSVVLFRDAEVVVGREAEKDGQLEPQRMAQWVKRDMGAPVYSRPIQGEFLPPEVIQACVLRRLKADLTVALGAQASVVITVPAYFDEPRRKATADAGEMAGLNVLDIVNEPTAAALAFGETIGYLSPSGDVKDELTVLVYDLGGGTFDVTLLRMAPGDIQALATDGDVRLGGHDWDARLVDHLAEAFRQTHQIDLHEDPIALNRLFGLAVDAKHALSARSRTNVHVQHEGRSVDVEITRAQFEEMTADLLERTLYTTRQLLGDVGMQWHNVDRLLLVGGSTRMPMVVEKLSAISGKTPERSVNPDEAVARGAALYAHYLLSLEAATAGTLSGQAAPGAETGFTVTNVAAHSLGVEGIDPETLRKTNVKLIPRNAPLPAKYTERFTTKAENQRSIIIQILQGENVLPEECTAIGRTVLADLPAGLPKAWPVDVTFEYETNGRLRVHAVVPGTHREVTLELERNVGLSNQGIEQWREVVASGAGFDAFEALIAEALEEELAPAAPASPTYRSQPAMLSTPLPPDTAPEPAQPENVAGPSGPISPATLTPEMSPLSEMAPTPVSPSAELPEATAASETLVATRPEEKEPKPSGMPRWLMILLIYLTSAAAGLAAGYAILHWLRPGQFPLPW
ncbi:MAG: Hsp70 family protein [Pirellulales bacterium]|nr:Hsp70 family protein [Pirellulales bacterium]